MAIRPAIRILLSLGAVATAALLLGDYVRSRHSHGDSPMRVAFPYDRSPGDYDPANITLAPEYIFLENTFSPLIEMDVHGTVTSGVASRFEWVGNEAVLTIRRDLFTADGYQITAHDAAISLKRLLILSGNTHGNLQDLLCRGKKITSLADDCAGLEVRGDQLVLKPGQHKPFLFPMLTAIDFAVIPAPSIDPDTLAIKDFRNTTGPYYVVSDAGRGHMTLKANPRHYHYSERMPQDIELVPMDKSDHHSSLRALERGQVDVVTTIDAATPEDVLQFYKAHADRFTIHATLNIRNIILAFSTRGLKHFSIEQRRSLGRQVREAFLATSASSIAYKPGVQFFPVFGEGGLSDEQIRTIDHAFNAAPNFTASGVGMRATIVRLAMQGTFNKILQDLLPGIVVEDGKSPAFVDYSDRANEMPMLSIRGPDTGFLEDIGLISYSMNSDYFNVPKEKRREWLNDYGNLTSKVDRIKKLNQLHFDALIDPVIVPLAVAPYVALATNDWDINLSKLFANNQLWLFKRK